MKARKFKILTFPDDLYNLDKNLHELETLEEQIEFLKYTKIEMTIHYKQYLMEEGFDEVDIQMTEEYLNKIETKLSFYNEIFEKEDKKGVTKREEMKKKDVETFDYDFMKIYEYADGLEVEKAIEYLEELENKVMRKDDFENDLDRLVFEDGIRKTLINKRLLRDKKQPFNIGSLNAYDFDESIITEYLNSLRDVNEKIIYLEFVLREIEKNIKIIDLVLEKHNDNDIYYSKHYRRISRQAFIYCDYKHKKEGRDNDKTVH